jgi:hypothetical protein
MAIPTQGGLNQASAAQAKPPAPQPAGNKAPAFDVSTAAAEHFEKQSETPAQDYASRALEERRKQSAQSTKNYFSQCCLSLEPLKDLFGAQAWEHNLGSTVNTLMAKHTF